MPCPLFLPDSPLGGPEQDGMPLGEAFGGRCSADEGASIPSDVLRECCNFGYARGRCERAAGAEADAFRFLIRGEAAGAVEVAWSGEREHGPVAVGTLRVRAEDGVAAGPLERQAQACVASYRRRMGHS